MTRLRTLLALCAALCASLILIASPGFAELAPLAAAPPPPPAAPDFDITGIIKALLSGDWVNGASVAALGGFALLEFWLGSTKKIEPNSSLAFVFKLVKGAVMGAIAALKGGGSAAPAATFSGGQHGQDTGPDGADGVRDSQ